MIFRQFFENILREANQIVEIRLDAIHFVDFGGERRLSSDFFASRRLRFAALSRSPRNVGEKRGRSRLISFIDHFSSLHPLDVVLRAFLDETDAFENVRYVVDAAFLDVESFGGAVQIDDLFGRIVHEFEKSFRQESERCVIARSLARRPACAKHRLEGGPPSPTHSFLTVRTRHRRRTTSTTIARRFEDVSRARSIEIEPSLRLGRREREKRESAIVRSEAR